MRSVIAATITLLCLPQKFEKWTLEKRFRYSQRLWRNLDSTIKFAIWITASFLVLIFLFSFASGCPEGAECSGSKYSYFWSARPNEVGDTLAGVAGSLAFFWLIVTVMLQGKELAAQRKELRLSRQESAKMADALQEQAGVFRDELKQRQFLQKKEELDELLKALINKSKMARKEKYVWHFHDQPNSLIKRKRSLLIVPDDEPIDQVVRRISLYVKGTYHILDEVAFQGKFLEKPKYPERLYDLLEVLEKIILLK